tara:strand:+ start:886 stop:1515 length:630 start_codon:yes stop_codon:yes gene_type:complete
MAYGIQITGANNIEQIDSTLTSTAQFVVVSGGVTTTDNQAIGGFTAGDFLIGRPTSGSGVFGADLQPSPPTLSKPGTYKVLRAVSVSTVSSTANGSNYGLVIYKADGTTRVFDSRASQNGFSVDKIWHKASLAGGDQVPSRITTNNEVGALTTSTMVGLNGGFGSINQFYFDSSSSKVYFHSYLAFGGFGGLGNQALANLSEVLIGELK